PSMATASRPNPTSARSCKRRKNPRLRDWASSSRTLLAAALAAHASAGLRGDEAAEVYDTGLNRSCDRALGGASPVSREPTKDGSRLSFTNPGGRQPWRRPQLGSRCRLARRWLKTRTLF